MRWISRVAILFYLAILCTPQAFAVQDVRLSPLADSQLYALNLSHQQLAHIPGENSHTDNDDTPPALPKSATTLPSYRPCYLAGGAQLFGTCSVVVRPQQPRAPPLS
ncbi:hypothetical protein [Rheinheimera nanhaiensis]|uniref:Uncharacterized protein n=1 Tax=Rheinheimera nanhaiensis E407-8 TaxID=562729 RepID=I1DVH7_9GAMM|nr:hypothetical protein [Rheinheimera nanhaiensis]GAB58055.1 hypothetical protein RNAN_1026 [Rheinheimera nanhaiensis E407-8]